MISRDLFSSLSSRLIPAQLFKIHHVSCGMFAHWFNFELNQMLTLNFRFPVWHWGRKDQINGCLKLFSRPLKAYEESSRTPFCSSEQHAWLEILVMIGNLYHCSFRCLTSVSSRDPFFNFSFSVSLACFLDFVDSIYLARIFPLNYIFHTFSQKKYYLQCLAFWNIFFNSSVLLAIQGSCKPSASYPKNYG